MILETDKNFNPLIEDDFVIALKFDIVYHRQFQ